MAAYYAVEVTLNSQSVTVGIPSPQSVEVTIPRVGPAGPQGPQGEKGDPGEVSGSIAWDNVTDKPSTFAPSSHTHVAADITDFTSAVEAVSPPADWDTLANKPSSFTPSAHASSHHTGGTDAIAPNSISAAWALETRSWSFFSTSTYTLLQGRNVQLNVTLSATGVTGTITLPRLTTDSAQSGDELFIVLTAPVTNQTLIIERYIWTGSSYIGSTQTVVTATSEGAWRFRLLGGVWTLQPVANHTQPASTITGLATVATSGDYDDLTDKPTLGGAAALDVGTTTGTVAAGDDSRFTDTRDPNDHAASHAAAGSDPVFDQDLNTTDDVAFNSVGFGGDFTTDAEGLKWIGQLIFEPETNTFYDQTGNLAFSVGQSNEFAKPLSFTGETTASETRTNLGLGDSAVANIGTGAGEVAAGDHSHGNLTNDGKVGSTAGLPLKTGTAGVVEAGAFGTSAGEFAEGDHTHSQLHDRSHAMTGTSDHTAGNHKVFYSNGSGQVVELALGDSGKVLQSNGASAAPSWETASGGDTVSIEASAADILSVSSGAISAQDAGADRLVFWDDSASELAYLEAGSGLSISGTTLTVTASGGSTNLWIPASAFIPKTTAGCGVDSRETTTNDQNFDELLFDAGTDEFADALVVMPDNYNNSTITARFYWTAASGSGGVAWAIQGRAFANDDALDTAAGTAQLVTDTLIAADDMHVTSATSAVTIGGTPAANTPIQFTIYRDVSDAGDDLAVDARLLGVEIKFN